MARNSVITARLRRAPPVLVCKKCLGRIEDAKALRKALKGDLKRAAAARGIKGPRLVMTSCFGICPKRAVVVASAATLQEGSYLMLSDADASAEAVARLMGDRSRT